MSENKKTNSLVAALFEIQQAAPFINKGTDNPFFKSKYAALPEIWAAIKPLLGQHKVLVSHHMECVDGVDYIVTTLNHIPTAEKLESRSKITLSKNTAQEYGSYITYMRRYAVSAMLGLVTDEDDDGNAASHPKQDKHAAKPVDANEFAMLKTKLETAASVDEFNDAKACAKAAWARMTKDKQDEITKIVETSSARFKNA